MLDAADEDEELEIDMSASELRLQSDYEYVPQRDIYNQRNL
jgi:hypothetical protein